MILNLIKNQLNILENPVIQNFFSYDENIQLLNHSKKHPNDTSSISLLNKRFHTYFTNVKRINYLASLIRGTSIDYDKKMRNYSSRYISTDIFNEEECLIVYDDSFQNDNFDSLITNKHLLMAIKSLTPKQINILEMFFIHSKNNLEIADYYNTTPQNVSQIRKKAIKKLQNDVRKSDNIYVS